MKGKLLGKKRTALVISLICILLITVSLLYYFLLYPNRSLGLEGDAKDLHYDLQSKSLETLNQGVTVRLDNYVFFTVNGKQYMNISAKERVKYGLLEEEVVEEALKPVVPQQEKDPVWYKHHFVRGDIGKKMGIIEESNHRLTGLKVYHYSAYPDSDDICIVKLGGKYGYEFFVSVPSGNESR